MYSWIKMSQRCGLEFFFIDDRAGGGCWWCAMYLSRPSISILYYIIIDLRLFPLSAQMKSLLSQCSVSITQRNWPIVELKLIISNGIWIGCMHYNIMEHQRCPAKNEKIFFVPLCAKLQQLFTLENIKVKILFQDLRFYFLSFLIVNQVFSTLRVNS